MAQILEVFKNYFGISFLLLIVSYLSPKETYRRYFQFLIGVLIAVMLFQPVAAFLVKWRGQKSISWEKFADGFEQQELELEVEEDLIEYFGLETESEELEEEM